MNLVFCNSHLQQILKHGLHSRVVEVNVACSSAPARTVLRRRMDLNSSRRNDALRRALRCRMLVTAEQTTQSALLALWRRCLRLICAHILRRSTSEWLAPCVLVRILLTLVHLLLELLRLLLVCKAQARKTFFQLESMEEGPILVVAP